VRVALAHWQRLDDHRLAEVAGFDVSPFNRLEHVPRMLKADDPDLALCSEPADLFDFDFSSGGPFPSREARLELTAQGGPINGVVQWIRLQLDPLTAYENRPAPGASSCWAPRFHPLDREITPAPDSMVVVRGAHTRDAVRIWAEV
jgi:type II protein arginine methyltransferase